METSNPESPLKVCRHCSVATRTDAGNCPSCGRSYGRGFSWSSASPLTIAALVAGVIAVAFALGFFVIAPLVGDDVNAISPEEGEAIQLGVSATELEAQLGEPAEQFDRGSGAEAVSCAYYEIEDEPERTWEYCFMGGELVSSRVVKTGGD